MNSIKLEKKIKRQTSKKQYEEAKQILIECYKKHFKKMLKYKKVKLDKKWYMYDYIIHVRDNYKRLFQKEVDQILDVLYTSTYTAKEQIEWMLDNSTIFDDYKI